MSDDDRGLRELRDLWRSQPVAGMTSREETLARVRAKAQQHDRAVFWRSVRETAAGALLIGVMAWTSWLAPGFLPKAGGLVGVAGVLFVIGKLSSSRRAHPATRPDLPLVDWLSAESRKVEADIDLLRSVRSWYLAPLVGGAAVWSGVLMAVGLASLPIPRARLALALALCAALMVAVLGAVGWAVWKLNQYGVTRYLEPYLKELRELSADIQSPAEADRR